ncbi:alkaline phosphatase family protein [Brachybacterium sp. AOP42-C2-15]|uniref:alkaline phosphatase family protein n=1 Tax=unclassified Brachybacterium TaxID=2623841 RepID=UPI003F917FB3
MSRSRTLLLAVDGLDENDLEMLRDAAAPVDGDSRFPVLSRTVLTGMTELRIRPGGPSEPAPALASLITGASVAHTGVATAEPFALDRPESRSAWYASSMAAPTLFTQAHAAGLVTAALQWPATAGAEIDLCLPLVEDLHRYRTRWEMAVATSSSRMVAEHLALRREAGVQLSQVPPDDLVAEIAAEALERGHIDLLAARLTGLAITRRTLGPGTAQAQRALLDTADVLEQILTAFAPVAEDRVLLVPGRPLIPTTLLAHPNTTLAAHGLLRAEGNRLEDVDALVWPDGPRGVVHVRREAGAAARTDALRALSTLSEVSAHGRLSLRQVDDGVGASDQTDVIAVLEGDRGTVFGLSATHRSLVEGDDPYYAGPCTVSDPSAVAVVLACGPGLPASTVEGSWADLGVTLAHAIGLSLPGATAAGMSAPAAATA